MLRIIYLSTFLLAVLAGDDWGYRDHNGPDSWPNLCQTGLAQSPIDIRMKDVDYAILHRLHFIHYDHPGKIEVVNNGHTLSVSGFDKWENKQPYVQGGGLKHKYKLVQFHLHWAAHDHHGSEHKIGGLHYPAEINMTIISAEHAKQGRGYYELSEEQVFSAKTDKEHLLHLVHVRSDLSLQQALTRPDGLAVVAVMILVDHDGSAMSALDKIMEEIVTPNNRTNMFGFRTRPMLPQSTDSFYRYEGSLTTPPSCAEAVIWTILAEPISMTRSQMTLLRQLQASDLKPMGHNYRPAQPLNGRRVLFRPNQFDKSLLCPSSSSLAFSVFSFVVSAWLSM